MYGYIYKTTFPNGMIYIGQKKGDKVANGYYGSGALVKIKIKEFGKENLKRDILDWCETPELLNDRELYWIALLDSTNPDIGYNLSIGGEHRSLGCKFSAETREKMGAWQRGKKKPEEACRNMSIAQRNYAKIETPEHKKARFKKFSETMKNKSDDWKKMNSERLSKRFKNKPKSEEQRMKMSLSAKGRKKSIEHRRNLALAKSKSIFTYGDKTFYLIKDLINYIKDTEGICISEYKLRSIIKPNKKVCSEYPKLKYEIKEIKKELINN